jgi:hypothetical protein
MEYQFECDFTPTVRKSANRIRKLSPGRTILMLILGIGFFAYIMPAAVVTTLLYGFQPNWVFFALVSVVYLLYGIFMPEISGYIWVRRFKKNSDSYHISFSDNIEIRQGNVRVYWEYTEIKQVMRLKYHYELQKNKRTGIMLDPSTLTGGTFEEFKAFLREKCPDLKIPD